MNSAHTLLEHNSLIVTVDMIRGTIGDNRVFSILGNLKKLGRSVGSRKLIIRAVLANEKLLDILVSRYNASSVGGFDTFTVEL